MLRSVKKKQERIELQKVVSRALREWLAYFMHDRWVLVHNLSQNQHKKKKEKKNSLEILEVQTSRNAKDYTLTPPQKINK